MEDKISVPGLFSSLLEAEEIPFNIGTCTQESSVKLRPMNADKLARYRDSVTKFSVREGEDGAADEMCFEPDRADSDVALLVGTIVTMTIFYDKPDGSGGTLTEQFPFPVAPAQRINFFKELVPETRDFLVKECKRINGLGPLSTE